MLLKGWRRLANGQQTGEVKMRRPAGAIQIFLVLGLASGFSHLAAAQPQAATGVIPDNDGIYIDGTTFTVIPGKAKGPAAGMIKTLGARELGPGAIVFRSGKKLYIVDVPILLPGSGSANGQGVFLNANKEQANRIRIEYLPAKNPDQQNVYDTVKARNALEHVQKLFSPFRLPVELTVKTLGCDGVANAWYEREESRPTVSVCYPRRRHPRALRTPMQSSGNFGSLSRTRLGMRCSTFSMSRLSAARKTPPICWRPILSLDWAWIARAG